MIVTASIMADADRMAILCRLRSGDEPLRSTLKLIDAWLDNPALSWALTSTVWSPFVRFSNFMVVFSRISTHEALSSLIS